MTDISAADRREKVAPLAPAGLISEAGVGDYLALMKPRVMSLVVFTAFVGLMIAPGHIHPVLGFTALLLTLAGYWSGRYGETTGRDRSHAPLLSIAVITFLYQITALILRYLLGEPAPAGDIFGAIVQTVLLNVILTVPVYALTRRLLRPREWTAREVRLLG